MKIKFMPKGQRIARKEELQNNHASSSQSALNLSNGQNLSAHQMQSQTRGKSHIHQNRQPNQAINHPNVQSDLPILSEYLFDITQEQNDLADSNKEQRERSRDKKNFSSSNIQKNQKQKEFIKNKYLGLIKQEKSSRHNTQYKSTLNFQWDKSQDTSGVSPDNLSSTLLTSHFLNRKKDFLEERSESYLNKPYTKMTERDWRIFRQDNQIYIKGGKIQFPFRDWNQLEGLNETLKVNLAKLKFQKPKPIQMQAIPVGMALKDLMAIAPTGEGKTLAYLIPIIQFMLPLSRLNSQNMDKGPYAIVLVPSRELAEQIESEFIKLNKDINLVCYTAVGGHQIDLQAIDLSRGCDILIGTPGRIKQLLDKHYLSLERLSWCVIDEADKMISENLSEEVEYILDRSGSEHVLTQQHSGKTRVTHLFSATMVPEIQKLASTYLGNQSAYITIGEPGGGKKSIQQYVQLLDQFNKPDRLGRILKSLPGPIIVFVNQREKCEKLTKKIQEKWARTVGQYHGGKNQEQREKIISQFRSGKFQILVATDLAGRGLDVKGINAVINYDAPKNISQFIHRAGRTGRAGMKGKAFTFLTSDDEPIFYDIRVFMQRNEFQLPENLKEHPSAQVKPGTAANIARRKQIVYTN